MITEWIMVGGIIFWILTALVSLILISAVANDSGQGATAVAGLYLATIVLLGDFAPIAWIIANPIDALIGFGAYYIAGVIYTYFKWYRFCLTMRNNYLREKRDFLDRHGITGDEIPSNLMSRFTPVTAPKVGRHKSTIIMWLAYWPFSLAGTFVADIIHNVFIGIYNYISGSLQRVSDNVWKDING